MSTVQNTHIEERVANYISGWVALLILLLLGLIVFWYVNHIVAPEIVLVWATISPILFVIVAKGLRVIPPNMAVVLTFFGEYAGTISENGFFWCNPLSSRRVVSLRINNFTTDTIKINDKNGNPIEIASVISWRISDTAKATFAVADCANFVKMACESAIREVASSRVYDHSLDENEQLKTLRGDLEGVAKDLEVRIGDHVEVAGIEILTAKITHLAYAPEIAMAMLRKQQATAVVAARKQIVEGAVGMVKQALEEIESQNIVTLNDGQKASLVTNLLTVLVSESETQPVLTLNKS
jgi:regulator of protease activity HflC (stomatin/prohibitin superfamily)